MKILSSSLLLLPLVTVSGEDVDDPSETYFENNQINSSPPISNTYEYKSSNGNTYSNSHGNTYSNINGNTYSSRPQGGNPAPVGGGNFNDMGGYLGNMMTMMFGQCLNNIDLEMMKKGDPFGEVSNRCNDQQAATFNSALNTFKTCAGFDLKLLIEEFGSVYIGLLMNCGSYVMEVTKLLDELPDFDQLKQKDSPLPRVPQQCVDALIGKNPFGEAFLYVEEFPEQEQKCFSELSGKLPMCALNEWPVPIVGSWLSAISCIYGNSQDILMPLMEDATAGELGMLDNCIPDGGISPSDCKAIRNECLFDYDGPAMSMLLPPPFFAPPMSQTLKDIAVKENFEGLPDKYGAYRQACIPPDDLAVWEVAATHKAKSDVKQGGASYYMESSSEEGEAEEGEATNKQDSVPLSAAAPAATASNSSSSSTKFMPGLLTGMIVAFAAMFGYNKYRNGDTHTQVPSGYHFNSLELS